MSREKLSIALHQHAAVTTLYTAICVDDSKLIVDAPLRNWLVHAELVLASKPRRSKASKLLMFKLDRKAWKVNGFIKQAIDMLSNLESRQLGWFTFDNRR